MVATAYETEAKVALVRRSSTTRDDQARPHLPFLLGLVTRASMAAGPKARSIIAMTRLGNLVSILAGTSMLTFEMVRHCSQYLSGQYCRFHALQVIEAAYSNNSTRASVPLVP